MKRLLLVCVAALALTSVLAVEAYAQRGGRGGGAMAIGGGGVGRGVAMGGAGRGIAVGGPARGIGVGGLGRGIAVGGVAPGYAIRGGAGRPGLGVAGRPGWGVSAWRPGLRRWGFPVAAGIALAGGWGYYNNYPYYDRCLAWDGWRWVNICYQPYPYGYW